MTLFKLIKTSNIVRSQFFKYGNSPNCGIWKKRKRRIEVLSLTAVMKGFRCPGTTGMSVAWATRPGLHSVSTGAREDDPETTQDSRAPSLQPVLSQLCWWPCVLPAASTTFGPPLPAHTHTHTHTHRFNSPQKFFTFSPGTNQKSLFSSYSNSFSRVDTRRCSHRSWWSTVSTQHTDIVFIFNIFLAIRYSLHLQITLKIVFFFSSIRLWDLNHDHLTIWSEFVKN